MQNDPQQEIFTGVKIAVEKRGYSVYDGMLPPDDTPYPFVYLGDCRQLDEANKSAVFGNVFLTIHFWHNNVKRRGAVSRALLDIKTACREIEHTENFAWAVRDVTQQIISDTTTKSPLLHGVLEVEWKFS